MSKRTHGPRRRNRSCRRGFAGLVAIALLLLIAVTLATVATSFSADARRTRVRAADAQLRQLLTAGAIAAAAQLDRGDVPTGEKPLALPQDLSDHGASATLGFTREGDELIVHLRATYADGRMNQVIRFEQSAGKWAIASAVLE